MSPHSIDLTTEVPPRSPMNGCPDATRRENHEEKQDVHQPLLPGANRPDGSYGNNGQRQRSKEHDSIASDKLGALLHQVSIRMGLTPVRQAKNHQHHHHYPAVPESRELHCLKRSQSELPPSRNGLPGEEEAAAPSAGPMMKPRDLRRRRTSICRGQSPAQPLRPDDHATRDSFELKQSAIYSMQTDGTLEQLSALHNLRVEEAYNQNQNLWRRLAIRASKPDTSQKELIQRSTFLVISCLTVGAGVLWGMMYVALREWTAALMPFIYSTSMGLILFMCICHGRTSGKGVFTYDTFAGCQLTLILLLPFAVHVALGGVAKSGGVMLWSFLCPMGAAFFRGAKESICWFYLYLGISGLLLVKEFWDVDNDIGTSYSSSSETIQKLYFLMNIIGVKCVIFAAVFLFARELEKEYSKSEEVLLNILPSPIIKRIKRGEFPIVDHVADVTILFADLVGFTKASTEFHPNFLIGLFLRDIFLEFDDLVAKHKLEKIKTIGDAYMVVGGLGHGEQTSSSEQCNDTKQTSHATDTMLLATDMFQALEKVNKKYNLQFVLRIGVHTGPVVAGVLGLKRFTYDVWGDAVNTASRMESNGVPGLIHLSSDMHEAIGEDMAHIFDFSCCGKICIKGKGEMTTYLAQPR